MTTVSPFSGNKVSVSGEFPLVVSRRENREVDFITWAGKHQGEIAEAIKNYGAVVFRGFGIDEDNFHEVYHAAIGKYPEQYRGPTPRPELKDHIYLSTVLKKRSICLHQEVSCGKREDMPAVIAFACAIAPTPGTGRTLVGSAKNVTEDMQKKLPRLWEKMLTTNLTYTTRYLPTNSWRTRWIRWLNPTHSTIERRFGTEKKEEVEAICKQEGLTCTWDGQWAIVSRSGVSAITEVDGVALFCNQIHMDKFNPHQCGGWFKYLFARLILYPTARSMQFDVQFDDGTLINRNDASIIHSLLEKHEMGIDWEKGNVMFVNNFTTMHAKSKHTGERKILVAMSKYG